jgi:lambda family phage portal protein
LHAVMRKLNDMDGYSEAEIVAARGAASYVWWIKTPENPDSTLTTEAPDGSREMEVEPGLAKWLAPGEEIVANTPNRPNSAMDPFMRLMLREVAAGGGTSYESLSRDYSQTTYSSGRLAMVDDRDLWRGFQRWFIRSFREPLHRQWMQYAVYSGAIPAVPVAAYVAEPERYEYVRFKPRGWSWIDPSVEVESYKSAIRAGITTLTDVIAQTGNGDDIEDVLERRARELVLKKQMEERYGVELNFDTDPDRLEDGAPADPPKPEAAPPPKEEEKEDDATRQMRVVSFGG